MPTAVTRTLPLPSMTWVPESTICRKNVMVTLAKKKTLVANNGNRKCI
jgi:hypothetical protein